MTGQWTYRVHKQADPGGPVGAGVPQDAYEWWDWEIVDADGFVILEGGSAEDPSTLVAEVCADHNATDDRGRMESLGEAMRDAANDLSMVVHNRGDDHCLVDLALVVDQASTAWQAHLLARADAERAAEVALAGEAGT